MRSPRARNKIKHWFSKERREEAIERGKDRIAKAMRKENLPIQRLMTHESLVSLATDMKYADVSALYGAVGEGHVQAGPFPAVILRLGGIYGPGRGRLIERVRSGEARCAPGAPVWSNRIHRDDAAGALAHLLLLDRPEGLYLGVDSEPSPVCEVYRYVASVLGVPPPREGDDARPGGSSKRCSNARLRRDGYRFEFPTYREGYRAVLDAEPGRGL